MKQAIILLFVFNFLLLSAFSIDLYLPSLPAIANSFHVSSDSVQFTMTMYLIGFCIGVLICGSLADHYGRRKVLLWGLGIFLLASIGGAFASNIFFLTIARFFQGLSVAAPGVLWRAVLRDHFSGIELARKTIYATTVWSFAPLVAPVLGSYLQHHFGWRANFMALGIFGFATWLLGYFYFLEIKSLSYAKFSVLNKILKPYLSMIIHRVFLKNITTSLALFGILMAFNVSAPFLLQRDLGFSIVQYGWLILVISSGNLIGGFVNNFLLNYFQPQQVLKIGLISLIILSAGMTLLALLGMFNVYVIAIPMFLVFLVFNLAYSASNSGALEPFAESAGIASGLTTFMNVSGGVLTTFLVTLLPESTQLPLALIILGFSLFALVMHFILEKNCP